MAALTASIPAALRRSNAPVTRAVSSSAGVLPRQITALYGRGATHNPRLARKEQADRQRCRVLSSSPGSVGSAPSQQKQQQARRVVLAVDASEDSIAAFNWVLKNLLKHGDELHLLHVVPDLFFGPASGSIHYVSSPDPETERMLWQQAKQFFDDFFVEHAKAAGLEGSVQLHLMKERRHHHIGKAVCKKAEELGAEPLVVAAHDKGVLEKMFLGSVSEFCVAHCRRPVLLLHPQRSEL